MGPPHPLTRCVPSPAAWKPGKRLAQERTGAPVPVILGGADAMQVKSARGTLRSVLSRTHNDEYCSSSSSKSVVRLQSSPRLLSSLLPYHTPHVECPSPNRLLLFLGAYMSSSQSAHIDTHPHPSSLIFLHFRISSFPNYLIISSITET